MSHRPTADEWTDERTDADDDHRGKNRQNDEELKNITHLSLSLSLLIIRWNWVMRIQLWCTVQKRDKKRGNSSLFLSLFFGMTLGTVGRKAIIISKQNCFPLSPSLCFSGLQSWLLVRKRDWKPEMTFIPIDANPLFSLSPLLVFLNTGMWGGNGERRDKKREGMKLSVVCLIAR